MTGTMGRGAAGAGDAGRGTVGVTRIGPAAGLILGGGSAPGLGTGAAFAAGVSVLDNILLNNPSMFCLSSFSLALRRAC